jgi:DNA-binding CsgD family transcriptional regulator/PAS domain-containing protein
MGWISFLAAVVLTLTLVEGVYILRQNTRRISNRLFFCMAASIAVWLLGAGLGYGSATVGEARTWFRISSPGFIFLHCCTFHFVLAYTGRLSSRAWRLAAWLSYLPSLVFQYIAWTGILVFRGFSQTGSLWIGEPDFGSLSFSLLMLQYLSYYALSIALLVHDALRSRRRRDRNQFLLIASGIGMSVLFFNIEPFLLPLISPYRTILVSPLFSIVHISAAAFAVQRYRFLSASAIAIERSTLDRLSDAIVLFDSRLQPVYANAAAGSVFPPAAALEGMVTEAARIRAALKRAEEQGSASFSCVLSSKAPGNARVDCRFSLIRDSAGELESILVVGIPIKDARTLHGNFSLTQAESRVVSMLVEGKQQEAMARELGVSIRTVKSHCTHVYQKLGVSSRIGMFKLLTEYKLVSSQAADQSSLPLLLKKPKDDS